MKRQSLIVAAVLLLCGAAPLFAQTDGNVSVMLDAFPDLDATAAGRQTTTELRTRIFVERKDDFAGHIRLRLSGYADGLLADRQGTGIRDAVARPQDAYVEFYGEHAELRLGTSRIVWGRLDEFQPTDVVNPLDVSRFLLEGRSEARLPVSMVRGRLFFGDRATVEALIVPEFRHAVYDQLDEPTSPFNLSAGRFSADLIERREPDDFTRDTLQGGVRTTFTAGRVDIGATAYRGFRSTSVFALKPDGGLLETFPRFTMISADFETAGDAWGIRGEIARFADDLSSATDGIAADQNSWEGGIGLDRRAGSYRLAANLLWTHRERNDWSVVFAADRAFARETRNVRVFGVYNPEDQTSFVRGIASFKLADNVALEGSGGFFSGSSAQLLGQFTQRDFAYARLKIFF